MTNKNSYLKAHAMGEQAYRDNLQLPCPWGSQFKYFDHFASLGQLDLGYDDRTAFCDGWEDAAKGDE